MAVEVCHDTWGGGTNLPGSPKCLATKVSDGNSMCWGETASRMCHGTYKYSGGTCIPGAGTPAPATTDPPLSPTGSTPTLEAGMCQGTFNGTIVKYKCAVTDERGPTTGSSPTGTTTGTEPATAADGPAGSTSTRTDMTCSGANSCSRTTITTTVNGDGTKTTQTSTVTGDRSTLCKGQIGLESCSGSGNGDGSGGDWIADCAQPMERYQCDGDAISCATARAVWRQHCLLERSSPEMTAYQSVVQSGTQTTGMTDEDVPIGPDRFQATELLGGGQCIQDVQITVMTQSVSLPFSMLCQYLSHLGNLLVSVAFLVAARVLVGGVRGD